MEIIIKPVLTEKMTIQGEKLLILTCDHLSSDYFYSVTIARISLCFTIMYSSLSSSTSVPAYLE